MSLSDEDDLFAGEYALGSLDAASRAAAAARRDSDPDFAAAVAVWEAWFLTLEEAGTEVPPPPRLWPAIQARLRGAPGDAAAPPSALVIRLDRGLRTWRRIALASMAVAACLALWVGALFDAGALRSGPSLVAVLQPADQQPAFLIRADLRDRAMAVEPIGARPVSGKSFELWVIAPALGKPKSLGVLDTGHPKRPVLPDIPADVLQNATYAVTVEPEGGSPTGAPSGAPIYVGHLVSIGVHSP